MYFELISRPFLYINICLACLGYLICVCALWQWRCTLAKQVGNAGYTNSEKTKLCVNGLMFLYEKTCNNAQIFLYASVCFYVRQCA